MIFLIILVHFLISTVQCENTSSTVPDNISTVLVQELVKNFSDVLTTTNQSEKINLDFIRQPTRRIISGRVVGETRPYMVYIRAADRNKDLPDIDVENWLCGGAIIHESYVLTSAACIEDAQHFYVVSGIHRWYPPSSTDNECINNGAKKAVWKCVPKSYVFDGREFDNIRWMINDIAVVKVEDPFNFEKRIKGCDYVPQKVAFNNRSLDLEAPNTVGSVAGWGSTRFFSDLAISSNTTLIPYFETATVEAVARAGNDNITNVLRLNNPKGDGSTKNSYELLETEVILMSKKACKKLWPERYHYIIDRHMICSKDASEGDLMSKACAEHGVNCKELMFSHEDDDEDQDRRRNLDERRQVKKSEKKGSGGFCENDHGGPLIVGYGKTSMVVGVISASLTEERTSRCHGPFLYTSVYNNRHLISCAIDKDIAITCKKLLRSIQTHMHETDLLWKGHPDGPSKTELLRYRDDDEDDDNDKRGDHFEETTASGTSDPQPGHRQMEAGDADLTK